MHVPRLAPLRGSGLAPQSARPVRGSPPPSVPSFQVTLILVSVQTKSGELRPLEHEFSEYRIRGWRATRLQGKGFCKRNVSLTVTGSFRLSSRSALPLAARKSRLPYRLQQGSRCQLSLAALRPYRASGSRTLANESTCRRPQPLNNNMKQTPV